MGGGIFVALWALGLGGGTAVVLLPDAGVVVGGPTRSILVGGGGRGPVVRGAARSVVVLPGRM